ncbi:MAG: hypothetical protein AAGK05_03895 [Pseudomonadota bacterium]
MGYKTFEDMKHNIPEGATHYQNETMEFSFAWFNVDEDKCFVDGQWWPYSLDGYPMDEIKPIPPTIKTESQEEREALDMIDTTSKQVESLAKGDAVEWDGEGMPPVGAKCEILFKEYQHKGFGLFNVLAYHSGAIWVQYIGPLENNGKCYTAECSTLEFRKPESPEQKAERERDEAIKIIQRDMAFSGSDYYAAKRLYEKGYRKQ